MEQKHQKLISQAKRRRNGKKWSITKMITEIESHVSKKGSRTKLGYLRNSLQDMLHQAIEHHEVLMSLLSENDPEYNDEWIDDLSLRINTCFSDIEKYFVARTNDPPSIASSHFSKVNIETWRKEVSESMSSISDKVLSKDVFPPNTQDPIPQPGKSDEEIAKAFSQLYIEPTRLSRSQITPCNSPYRSTVLNRRSRSLPVLSNNYHEQTYAASEASNEFSQAQSSYIQTKDPFVTRGVLKQSHSSSVKQSNVDYTIRPPENSHMENIVYEKVLEHLSRDRITRPVTTEKFASRDNPVHTPSRLDHDFSEIKNSTKKKSNQYFEDSQNPHHEHFFRQLKRKAVDSWIDELDPEFLETVPEVFSGNVQMQMLIQQRLPTQILPTFDGSPEKWVEFIGKFFDMVHKQPYLDSFQKHIYLTQHLKAEPAKAVAGYSNDSEGYVNTLKRLKYMFGDPALVAHATIQKVVSGKQLANDDPNSLKEFYYSLSACLNTLRKMNYTADIYSTDVLRQTLARLPSKLLQKWSEYSFKLRQKEQPSLINLEKWLQDRVMASKDPLLPSLKTNKSRFNGVNRAPTAAELQNQIKKCVCCGNSHNLYQCDTYKSKTNSKKLEFVKLKELCFNCLQSSHSVKTCPSKRHCFTEGCQKRHHTSLHDSLKGKPPVKSKHDEIPKLVDSTVGVMKGNRHVYLQIVPVKVTNRLNHKSSYTYALLDGGSQCTIIKKSLCMKLGLNGRLEQLNVGTFKDDEKITTKIVSLNVSSQDGKFNEIISNVYSFGDTKFNVPAQQLPSSILNDSKWSYIEGLDNCNVNSYEIQMLIGADVSNFLVATEIKKGRNGMPYASRTPFGWALIGVHEEIDSFAPGRTKICHIRQQSDNLDSLDKQFWETESFGTNIVHRHFL